MKTKNMAAIIIGILTAISFCVIFILSTKTLHYIKKAYNMEVMLGETLILLDEATSKGQEYQKHSEELEKHLEKTISQAEVLKKIAETSIENIDKAQKQVNKLLIEVQWYQEHVNDYITVILWYEKKCGNCPDTNLPEN